jgi:tyrosinase
MMGYAGDALPTGDANGVVALTDALEDRLRSGELSSLDEDTVAQFLNENMSWMITTVCRPRAIKKEVSG